VEESTPELVKESKCNTGVFMSEVLYQYTHDQWGPNITTKYTQY